MLSVIDFTLNDKVLDLGCGYGIVGILASKIMGGRVLLCVTYPERQYNIQKSMQNLME